MVEPTRGVRIVAGLAFLGVLAGGAAALHVWGGGDPAGARIDDGVAALARGLDGDPGGYALAADAFRDALGRSFLDPYPGFLLHLTEQIAHPVPLPPRPTLFQEAADRLRRGDRVGARKILEERLPEHRRAEETLLLRLLTDLER